VAVKYGYQVRREAEDAAREPDVGQRGLVGADGLQQPLDGVEVAEALGVRDASDRGVCPAVAGLDRRSGRRGQEVEALAGRRRVSAPRVRLKPRPPV